MFEDIMFKLIVAFGAAAIALAGWALAKLTDFLSQKAGNEYWKGVISRLDDAAINAVKSVHQAFVSGLKNKDKFSDEDKKQAKAMALDALKSYMGQKGLDELMKLFNSDSKELDQKLNDKIESAVNDMKNGK